MDRTKVKSSVFANREGLAAQLLDWMGDAVRGRPHCVVCVSNNAKPADAGFRFPARGLEFSRALILLDSLPVDVEIVGAWRDWAVEKGTMELHVVPLDGSVDEPTIKAVRGKFCKGWISDPPPPERPAITAKQFVRLAPGVTRKDDPSHLTMMFGSMGELLTAIDIVGRSFRGGCRVTGRERREYLKKIDALLAGDGGTGESADLGIPERLDHLPRILLVGETGVGKTLIARYLHGRSGATEGGPLRIPIPEYLGKEDMFEYDLFGYAKGAYTDAADSGRHGQLLENVGGVVFLDEIGEANEVIQAKLLAYLDDYRVRPRKWEGTPFYCPTLVVAATNRPLEDMVRAGSFRGDLLARFTDRHTIPPLRDRVEDLHFILDCLLQRQSMNPDGRIEEIGEQAFVHLKSHGFREGNFRELEDVFRLACQRAMRDGRTRLCVSDFSPKRR